MKKKDKKEFVITGHMVYIVVSVLALIVLPIFAIRSFIQQGNSDGVMYVSLWTSLALILFVSIEERKKKDS